MTNFESDKIWQKIFKKPKQIVKQINITKLKKNTLVHKQLGGRGARRRSKLK